VSASFLDLASPVDAQETYWLFYNIRRSRAPHGSMVGGRCGEVHRQGQGPSTEADRSITTAPISGCLGFGAPRRPGQSAILAREMIPFLRFGPILVPTFGLMIAAAMVVAYYVLRADMARRGLAARDSTTAEMFVAVPALVGIVGAKLYHVLETPRDLFADPLGQLFSRYGLAWFGGLIAGFAAFVWLARRHKFPLLEVFDAGSAAATLGYGIGRIGCLLSGDGDYGTPTSLPWGMSFPHGLVPTTDRVHPTPIYELIAACAIAWILWRLGTKQLAARNSTKALPAGEVFAAYLALTGVARFLVEFIRINPRSFFGLTNAQAASLVSVIAGAALWWYVGNKQPRKVRVS
jgi:phosphatidylglycerol:prolipoprotein diacylglycerol transferase